MEHNGRVGSRKGSSGFLLWAWLPEDLLTPWASRPQGTGSWVCRSCKNPAWQGGFSKQR